MAFVLSAAGPLVGQVPDVDVKREVVEIPTRSTRYYIVQERDDSEWGFKPGTVYFGDDESLLFDLDFEAADAVFYRVTSADIADPYDLDGDGMDDLFEYEYRSALDLHDPSDRFLDSDGDGRSNYWEYLRGFNPSVNDVLTTFSSSPVDGADDVAVTHETVLTFTRPLKWQPTQFDIKVTAAGQPVKTRIVTSSDLRRVTLFYPDFLPASSEVKVSVNPSNLKDVDGNRLDLDGDGLAGGVGLVEFTTLSLSSLEGTSVVGRVFASDIGVGGEEKPLSNVLVTLDGREDEVWAVTDQFGDFRLEPVPAGRFFVHLDGKDAVGEQPAGSYYPRVGKAWESVVGEETHVGEIYLPLIAAGTLTPVSNSAVTEVKFPQSVLDAEPSLAGVKLDVPPGALISQFGTVSGSVGIAPVDPDRLPGPLPEGLELPLVITVQSDGPGNFDVPVPATFPNLPDPVTGVKLGPGAKSALWSFDHDEGRWVIVGSMTVTEDGNYVKTDPGYGILAPGWHGAAPGVEGEDGDILEDEDDDVCDAGSVEVQYTDGGFYIFRISTPGFAGYVKWSAPGGSPDEGYSNVLQTQYCEAGTYTVTAYLIRNGEDFPCTSRTLTINVSEEDVDPDLTGVEVFVDPLEFGGSGSFIASSTIAGVWIWALEGEGEVDWNQIDSDDGMSSIFAVSFCEAGDYVVKCRFVDFCGNPQPLEDYSITITDVEPPEFLGGGITSYLDPFDDIKHSTRVQARVVGDGGSWSWSIEPSAGVSLDHSSFFDANSFEDTSEASLEFCEVGTYELKVVYRDNACGEEIEATQTLEVTEGGVPDFNGGITTILDPFTAIEGFSIADVEIDGEANGTWAWSISPDEGVTLSNSEIYDPYSHTTQSSANIRFCSTGSYTLSVSYTDPDCGETVSADQALTVVEAGPEFKGDISSYFDPLNSISQYTELQSTIDGNAEGTWSWSIDPSDGVELTHDELYSAQFFETVSTARLEFCATGQFTVTASYTDPECGETISQSQNITVIEGGTTFKGDGITTYLDPFTAVKKWTAATATVDGNATGTWSWTIVPSEGVSLDHSESYSAVTEDTTSEVTLNFCEEGEYGLTVTYYDPECGAEVTDMQLISVIEASDYVFQNGGIQQFNTDSTPNGFVTQSTQLSATIGGNAIGNWAWSVTPTENVSVTYNEGQGNGVYDSVSDATFSSINIDFCATGNYFVELSFTDEACGETITTHYELDVLEGGPEWVGAIDQFNAGPEPDGVVNGSAVFTASLKGIEVGNWIVTTIPNEGSNGPLFFTKDDDQYLEGTDSTELAAVVRFCTIGTYDVNFTFTDEECGKVITISKQVNVTGTDPNCVGGNVVDDDPLIPLFSAGDSQRVDGFGNPLPPRFSASPSMTAEDEDGIVQLFAENGETRRLTKAKGLFYYYNKNRGSGGVRRGTAGTRGTAHPKGLRMREERNYEEYILEADTLRVAYAKWRTPEAGNTFELPDFILEVVDGVADSDLDGLHDLGEMIMGTDRNDPDSDDDGVLDGAEVILGSNPTSNQVVRTGLINTLDLDGDALDICAVGDYLVVAGGKDGVSIVNIFNGLEPVFMSRIDTAGTAQAIACTDQFIAVADGDAGLAIIELRDPANESILLRQVSLPANAVAVAASPDLAYIGLSDGQVVAVDYQTGQIVDSVSIDVQGIEDLVLGFNRIYAVSRSQLHTLAFGSSLELVHSQAAAAEKGAGGRRFRLFAGEDFLYLTHTQGYNTYELGETGIPQLVKLGDTLQFGWKQTVDNGEGLALAAVSPNSTNDGPHHVSLFDSSSLEVNDAFLEEFRTPGIAASIALSNGLAYVADTFEGLQVINYLAPDRLRRAPTLSLSHNFTSGQAEENAILVVRAHASDDVQTRSVDFYQGGQRIHSDGSYPYELRLRVPEKDEQATLNIAAIARDTAGNASSTVTLSLQVTDDATIPEVLWFTPSAGAEAAPGDGFAVNVKLSEAIDLEGIELATILKLYSAGQDGVLNTEDDVEVDLDVSFNVVESLLTGRPTGLLAGGSYRVSVPSGLKDAAGNTIAVGYDWNFSVPGPKIVSHSPNQEVEPFTRNEISVTADRAIDFGALTSESLVLEEVIEGGDDKRINGAIITSLNTPKKVTLRLPEGLPPGGYRATASGILDTHGNQIVEYSWEFTVRRTKPIGFFPGVSEVVANGQGIGSVVFDSAMDVSSLAAGVELRKDSEDGVAVGIEQREYLAEENRLNLVFDSPLPSGYYFWHFGESVRDAEGYGLEPQASSPFFIVNSLGTQVVGEVRDSDGDPVDNATVAIRYEDVLGVERTAYTRSDFDGSFSLPLVAYDSISVQARYPILGSNEVLVSGEGVFSVVDGGDTNVGALVVTSEFGGELSSGHGHTLWIDEDQTLRGSGSNGYGQVGTGTSGFAVFSPTEIGPEGASWKRVSAGRDHSVGIQSNGTLWAWGSNALGQLGDGTQNDSLEPMQVGTGWSDVSAGGWFTVGIKSDGTLWSWGYAPHGKVPGQLRDPILEPAQIGTETDWSKVSAGNGYVLAVKSNGTLWAWGANGDGQLGDGTKVDQSDPVQIGSSSDWVTVAAGYFHSLALKLDGTLWAWGSNEYSQVGDGTTERRLSPIQIGDDEDWVSIAAGSTHSVGRKTDESGWFWGFGVSGTNLPGTDTYESRTPQRSSLETVKLIAASFGSSDVVYGEDIFQRRGATRTPNNYLVRSTPSLTRDLQYGKGVTRFEIDFLGDLDPENVNDSNITFIRINSNGGGTSQVGYDLSFASGTSKLILELDNPLSPSFSYNVRFLSGLLDAMGEVQNSTSTLLVTVSKPRYTGQSPEQDFPYAQTPFPDVSEVSVSSESIFDAATIGEDALKVFDLGEDGLVDTADDFEVPGTVSFDEASNRITLAFEDPLPVGSYYAEPATTIRNEYSENFIRKVGNFTVRNYWFFGINEGPEVHESSPADGDTYFYNPDFGSLAPESMSITFTNTEIDPATLTMDTVKLRRDSVAGAEVTVESLVWDAETRTLLLLFEAPLADGAYYLDLSTAIEDTSDRALQYDDPVEFTVEQSSFGEA